MFAFSIFIIVCIFLLRFSGYSQLNDQGRQLKNLQSCSHQKYDLPGFKLYSLKIHIKIDVCKNFLFMSNLLINLV